jgi:hypothetical protein
MEYLLKSLKIMFLHEEVRLKASKEHRGFVIWCQENLLIKKYEDQNYYSDFEEEEFFDNYLYIMSILLYSLWELMDAEYSQLCEHAVPILVHCITLPVGADTFWKQIEEDFQSPDWRRRFTAGLLKISFKISKCIDNFLCFFS